MPNQYYSTPFFRASLIGYFLVFILSYWFWYNTIANPPHASWIPLTAYIVLGFILVFFPSGSVRLPGVLVPAVQLFTLLVLQVMLDMLPHSLNTAALAVPALTIVMICTVLIQRSHMIAAWSLFGFSILLIMKWHLALFTPKVSIFAEFLVPAAVLFSNHLFKRQIELSAHKARQSRVLLQNAELGQAQERGVSSVASKRVAEVRALTEDMLHRIAYNPAPVTRDEINEFRFTEAQLRDTIRGRHIVNEDILNATLAARRRGAKVDILDERGEALPAAVAKALTAAAVDLLDSVSGGTVTIRAFPKDDPMAIMIVHDGNSEDDEPSAIEISPSGAVDMF